MLSQVPFWDSVAGTKTFSHPLDLNRFRAFVDRGARILDYGCGYGRLSGELYAAGYRDVTGVDPSPRMIERSRVAYPQITFDVLKGTSLPFADASFDAVLLFSVLTCVIDDDGQRAIVADIARVLRRGGIVYVSDHRKNQEICDRYSVGSIGTSTTDGLSSTRCAALTAAASSSSVVARQLHAPSAADAAAKSMLP